MTPDLDEEDPGVRALQRVADHRTDPTPYELIAHADLGDADADEYLEEASAIAEGASVEDEADDESEEETTEDAGAPPLPDEAPPAAREEATATREEYADAVAELSGDTFAPAWLTRREWWVPWVLAYKYEDWESGDLEGTKPNKQPIAPYNGREGADPVRWNSELPEEDRPQTDYATAEAWRGMSVGLDLPAPERVTSDEVGIGIILPRGGSRQTGQRPVVFIDWDDVRDPDPEDGDPRLHPECARALDELDCYAEVSQSGKGVHQWVFAELPGPNSQFIRNLDDEPFVGDDVPAVEMYTSGRLNALTLDHIEGTGRDVTEGQATVDRLCWEYGTADNNSPGTPTDPYGRNAGKGRDSVPTTAEVGEAMREAIAYDGTDPDEWDVPDDESLGYHAVLRAAPAGNSIEAANWELMGYAAAFAARDGKPQEEAIAEIVAAGEYDEARVRSEVRSVYAKAEANDYAPPSFARLARRGLLPDRFADDSGSDGYSEASTPVVAVPFGQLEALSPEERKDAAAERGVEPPTTGEARARLTEEVHDAMANGDRAVVEAPTSLGKSHTIAATPWGSERLADVTGGDDVIHLSRTKDARDEAAETAREAGVVPFVFKSRTELCPVAAGAHDPGDGDDGGGGADVVTMDGQPASEWLADKCDESGMPFSYAHKWLAENHDQAHDELPCAPGENSQCPATQQWEEYRDQRESEPDEGGYDVVMATHEFAHVPSLRMATHVVFDEEPGFAEHPATSIDGLTQDRVKRAVTALLRELGTPVSTWEDFISMALSEGLAGDARTELEQTRRTVERRDPPTEFYFENPNAHALAPAIVRALAWADKGPNGRYVADVPHEPPRLDARVNEAEGWNREWVRIVVDEEKNLRTVRATPDFSQASSVIGLDAHPSLPVWEANLDVRSGVDHRAPLTDRERQLWRRYERGLRVVQVGDATRSLAKRNRFNPRSASAIVEALRDRYGEEFRTFITTKAVRSDVADLMEEAGVDPEAVEAMHYGAEKSRNDFEEESVGFVHGCVDPGDAYVLDLGAELELDFQPELTECSECGGEGCPGDPDCRDGKRRAFGRGFTGPDAGVAAEILASVREAHVAQAAGRYARSPDDPESTATVFVQTDAIPDGFADVEVPGVVWRFGEKQRAVVDALREAPEPMSAKQLAEVTDVSKAHARKTLNRLVEKDAVQVFDGEGKYGANLYSATGLPTTGCVDLGDADTLDDLEAVDPETATGLLATREPAASAADGVGDAVRADDATAGGDEDTRDGQRALAGYASDGGEAD